MTDDNKEEDFGDNCLIEDEPEDGDDVYKYLIISQGLDVDITDITKQCDGIEPKVKARDAKNQVS